MSTLLPEM